MGTELGVADGSSIRFNGNHHVGRCSSNYVGAVMTTNGSGAFANAPISNTKIAHSKSRGIVSYADDTDTYYMTTSYAKPDITFEDIAWKALDFTGRCDP